MGRIFLILALIGAFFVWRRWRQLQTTEQRRDFIYKGIALGLVIFIIGLAVFGRIDMLGAVFASLLLGIKWILAILIRYFPFIARMYGVSNLFSKKRNLNTDWLKMEIDFQTRQMDAEVLKGQFTGRKISTLSEEEVRELVSECKDDQRSVYFLQNYLAQKFGGASRDQQSSTPTSPGNMSREEALEILGLEGSPEEKEIKTAHKQLMQKLHPDRGGNDFLASLLNRARDRLLHK